MLSTNPDQDANLLSKGTLFGKESIDTSIVEPFIPHKGDFYLKITSECLGSGISFSECSGIEIEENWDEVLLSGESIPLVYSPKACRKCHIGSFFLWTALLVGMFHFMQVKTVFVPRGVSFASEVCAPLVATLHLEVYICSLPLF